jgi:hypothetical protein
VKNQRDTPNFLHAALDMTACAAFIKESRMKFASAYKLHRKSEISGTQGSADQQAEKESTRYHSE